MGVNVSSDTQVIEIDLNFRGRSYIVSHENLVDRAL